MRDIAKGLTLSFRLRGVRRFRWRVWAGLWLVRLAAAVMGVGLCVEGRRRLNAD